MRKILLFVLLLLLYSRSFATVTFTLVSNTCDTNKILVAHYTGNIGPYNVYWSGGIASGWAYHTQTGLDDTLYNYAGGNTTVQIYNNNNSYSDTATYIGAPSSFSVSVPPITPYCTATTAVSATVTGGTPPYTYSWNNYNTGTTLLSNPAMLASGYYHLFVMDAAGCMAFLPSGFSVSPTPTYSVSVTTTDANCTNGTATVSGTSAGAIAPLSYLWGNGATSSSLAGLVQGNYQVTVTDMVGCIGYGSGQVHQAVLLTPSLVVTPATCLANDGAAIGFGSGGVPPYTYNWSNGGNTQSVTGLTSGQISLTVTDAHGCTGNTAGYVSATTPITVTYTATPSSCTAPTGTATLTISGGTPPYTTTFYSSPTQSGTHLANVMAGNYGFQVVDALGCLRTGTVVVPQIAVIGLSIAQTQSYCALSNGSMHVNVSGGAPPYSYQWSNGATSPSITGIPYGYYHVTVTDQNHCTATSSSYIQYVSPVTVGVSSTSASCLFVHDGSATAIGMNGTPPYIYHWNNGANVQTITGLATGIYTVIATDVNGCSNPPNTGHAAVAYNVADSSCFCIIKGTVYYDANGNCVRDAGEPGIEHIQVACSGMGYTYTNASGEYYFLVPAGTYTVSETILAFYPLAACQSNSVSVTTTTGAGCSHTVDFADVINPIHDVQIASWDYSFATPGSAYQQTVIVSNEGTVNEPNILCGYKTDGQLFSPSISPSGIFTGTGNWYSTNGGTGLSLAPGSSQQFYISYNVPTFIPIGTNVVTRDSAAYSSPMSNWLTDYSPWNNVNYRNTTVVASFDPNFVEVSPQGTGTPGNITYADSTLQYMVHFQNTGTAPAQNIVVIDTLDPNLDWTTMRPVFESAPAKVDLSANGVVKYTFANINLPTASSQPLASSGMFTYSIKTRHGLPLGTHFQAKANIFFDYNAPVTTNTTLNTLWSPEGVTMLSGTAQNNSFTIYPNPARQSFNAIINSDLAGDANMSITDVTGKTLMNKTVSLQKGTQTITTDASSLAPGIYFVTFNNHSKAQTQKLVIMK